jgi:exopolyphosphatase/guanosine-5'-triphosphate,3'-diphosphate pyrophosphatase
VRAACIDIGSNTTRLLVADVGGGALAVVTEQRAFTRLGRACRPRELLPPEAVAQVGEVVAAQVRMARALDAEALRVVATAAVRRAANGAEVCATLTSAAGVPVELLSEAEEARLAFSGATAGLAERLPGALEGRADVFAAHAYEAMAVVDVGGGSSQLAVGTPSSGVTWSVSLPIGSGDLAVSHLRSDPPEPVQLAAVSVEIAGVLERVAIPSVARALAVGGSATSLRRLAGEQLDRAALARGLELLIAAPADTVAGRTGIDAERVRLLPAGILVLDAFAERLGPLTVAGGGLREGVVRALAEG